MPEDVIQYEPQYDPNNDFKIFGVGDQKTGGIQDMKEKMNMADEKDQDSSSESEMDTNRGNQPMGVKQYNQAQHMAKETVLEGSSSQEGLTVGGSTGGKSSENLNNNNDLPENKEIHSSSEEEDIWFPSKTKLVNLKGVNLIKLDRAIPNMIQWIENIN